MSQRWRIREGEAPAEPRAVDEVYGTRGSAGATLHRYKHDDGESVRRGARFLRARRPTMDGRDSFILVRIQTAEMAATLLRTGT